MLTVPRVVEPLGPVTETGLGSPSILTASADARVVKETILLAQPEAFTT